MDIVKCEVMKLREILDLKVKTDERKFWPIMTVRREDR